MEKIERRRFLAETTGAAVAAITGVTEAADGAQTGPAARAASAANARRTVSILSHPADATAASPQVQWALSEVAEALEKRGVSTRRIVQLEEAAPATRVVAASGAGTRLAQQMLHAGAVAMKPGPEALAQFSCRIDGRNVLMACGSDHRGLMYSLLEIADRITYSPEPSRALSLASPIVERPANPVRSVARIFSSEVEDKPWFYDRAFWESYLSMLAANRFNRFSLMLGMAYDFLNEVTDAYFHFPYPFLIAVPGYDVRVAGLPQGERERNLAMLQFISETAASRGLDFHLGIWTHGYDWSRNPGVNYTIEGLSTEHHAAYCRDALRALLQACPAIQGVVFRIHGESGIPEPSYPFWRTVFDGAASCGRRVEINLHTKGLDQVLLDSAIATGLPVTVSPKFWAEHMGLPYQQASIRALELPPRDKQDTGFFAKSDGSRRFLRYGYGDLLTEDRKYGVYYRVWPGTQRHLLWGDPAFAAAYSRAGGFSGCQGMEICEPYSFKGRKGSGLAGGRDAYADQSLKPEGGDFEKHSYTYRLWGRLLYNPESHPDVWRRWLVKEFGATAPAAETALAHASRILPLVTTAHLPSAANNGFWPEVYTNMPIVSEKRPHPYGDTPSPRRFGTVSALDPALFSSIVEFVSSILGGKGDARISPVEVADWLEELADSASRHLIEAWKKAGSEPTTAFRRLAADVAIQSGLGRFFAHKLRAGVLFEVYRATADERQLLEALAAYRRAREAWTGIVATARTVYRPDITYGRAAHLRGSWQDRLAAIDLDIADMESERASKSMRPSASYTPIQVAQALHALRTRVKRPIPKLAHTPPSSFSRGKALTIAAQAESRPARGLEVALHFRRVNQADSYQAVEMARNGDEYMASIPAATTDSPFPLQYFFEVRRSSGDAALWPGFNADLTNQPYFVVRPG